MVDHLWMAVKTFGFIFLLLSFFSVVGAVLLALWDKYLGPPYDK